MAPTAVATAILIELDEEDAGALPGGAAQQLSRKAAHLPSAPRLAGSSARDLAPLLPPLAQDDQLYYVGEYAISVPSEPGSGDDGSGGGGGGGGWPPQPPTQLQHDSRQQQQRRRNRRDDLMEAAVSAAGGVGPYLDSVATWGSPTPPPPRAALPSSAEATTALTGTAIDWMDLTCAVSAAWQSDYEADEYDDVMPDDDEAAAAGNLTTPDNDAAG